MKAPQQLDEVARAFLDAIAVGETYDPVDYNELVGGNKFAGYEHFPVWEGRRFSTGISHAAGRYQFQPATWATLQAELRLPDFSPASQDIAAWTLAVHDYRRRVRRDLYTDIAQKHFVDLVRGLQPTWTSISTATAQRFLGAWAARRAIAAHLNV